MTVSLWSCGTTRDGGSSGIRGRSQGRLVTHLEQRPHARAQVVICPVGSQNVRPAQAGRQLEELDIITRSLAPVRRAAHHLRELCAARAEHPVAGRVCRAQKLARARAALHERGRIRRAQKLARAPNLARARATHHLSLAASNAVRPIRGGDLNQTWDTPSRRVRGESCGPFSTFSRREQGRLSK